MDKIQENEKRIDELVTQLDKEQLITALLDGLDAKTLVGNDLGKLQRLAVMMDLAYMAGEINAGYAWKKAFERIEVEKPKEAGS